MWWVMERVIEVEGDEMGLGQILYFWVKRVKKVLLN